MISEMIEEDARRLDDIVADLNKEAIRHRNARDDYNRRRQNDCSLFHLMVFDSFVFRSRSGCPHRTEEGSQPAAMCTWPA